MIEQEYPLPNGMEITINEDDVEFRFEKPIPGPPLPPEVRAVLGNLFFVNPRTGEQVEFFKRVVTIEIDFPPELLNEAYEMGKGKESIRFVYHDKIHKRWLPFQYQVPGDEDKLIVRFNFWIKDPNVGWGFL